MSERARPAVSIDLPSDDGRPLYRRLSARLREEIVSGRLKPGDLVSPEIEIARAHRISRHTVRAAIGELAREGLLRRERGRGTFVAPLPLVRSLGAFYSFAHEVREQGLEHRTRVLRRRVRPAGRAVALHLGLGAHAPIVELELLQIVEGAPVSLELSVWPADRFPAMVDAELTTGSLYDLLRDAYDVEVTLGRETLQPVVLDRRQASLLEVAPGTPAFHVTRVTLAAHEPIEWRRSLVRGDRYLFRVDLPVGG